MNWKRRFKNNLRLVELQDGFRKLTTHHLKHIFHDGKEADTIEENQTVKKTSVQRLVLFNSQNFPEKTYDLTAVPKIKMIATAYWVGDPQVPGTITFSGYKVRRGLVAVDPKVIPLGTRLYVPGYGYAYAADTGSAIKGKRIDLFVQKKIRRTTLAAPPSYRVCFR